MTHPTTFVDNTNLIEVRGLKSAVEDAFINDAEVTLTVVDADGEEVTGQVWPATMNYVAASDGWYRATIEHDAGLVAGEVYTAKIDAVADTTDAERVGHWEFVFTAKTRHGS